MRKFLRPLLVLLWASEVLLGEAPRQFALATESQLMATGKVVKFSWETPEPSSAPAYLGFDARIDAEKFKSGGTPALQVSINNVPVTIDRLVNKQTQWVFGAHNFVFWEDSGNTLSVLYHPWEDESPTNGRLHRYVFDITSLLRKNGANNIQFKSTFGGVVGAVVEIKNIDIQLGGEVAKNSQPTAEEPLYLSEPLAQFREQANSLHRGTQLTLDVTPDFQDEPVALVANAPLVAEPIEASFSAEGALQFATRGFSASVPLQVGMAGGGWKLLAKESGWQVQRTSETRVVYTNPRVRIEREIIPFNYGVSVRDRVTNLTGDILPIGLLYELNLGEGNNLAEFRMFGTKQSSFYANTKPGRLSATTPSLYFRNDRGSFGVVVEDDILRNQASYLAWDDTMAFGTDMFYLSGGGAHEFLWSIIPAKEDGYYDFLNKVRAKWNTFQEIPGLFGFVYPWGKDDDLTTPEKIKNFFSETGITNPCLPPGDDNPSHSGLARMIYGNEPASIGNGALARVADFTKMAEADGVKLPFLLYTDVHLARTDGDKKILAELDDSVIRDYRGNVVEYRPGWLINILSTEKTSAGMRFKENMEKYLATSGVGGIFLDEWDHSLARYSFNHPDGSTALLDENFKIRRTIGIVPLLIKAYQAKLASLLTQRGAVVYANQFDSTQSSAALPIVHFAEPTQYDSYLLRGAQMSRTPLSLTVKRSPDPWLDAQEFLKLGVLTCFYAQRLTGDHLLRHVFPITVRRSGPGYVIGDNRIVTLRSGEYSFGDERPVEAKIFGGPGGVYRRTVEARSENGRPTSLSLHLDRNDQEAAVLNAEANSQ